MTRQFIALVAGAFPLIHSPARAQVGLDVDVVVEGVRGDEGVVTASLCTREEFAVDDCRLMRSAAASAPQTIVKFSGVRPGRYGVEVFHDRDRDGEVARGLLGVPVEGVGFSRNPALWRRPNFDEVAVELSPTSRELRLKLRFEPPARSRR